MAGSHGSRGRFFVLVVAIGTVGAVGAVRGDFIFGVPTNLGPTANSSARDEEPGISADGLSIYFCSRRSGGYGGYDMWATHRATTQDDWGPPVNLGSIVNSSSDDFSEDISADGLELYFGSNRPGGSGTYDIWVAERATTQDDWTTPENLGPLVNSSSQEGCPAISDDGLELYFWSNRPGGAGGYDIWVSRRATTQDDWGTAENLGPTINSPAADLCTDVSPDGLLLILVSARSGGYGGNLGDLWMVRRPTVSEPWGAPANLGPMVNGSHNENGPVLSTDGSTLYFSSDRPGGSGEQDMWQVSINPCLDFNGDGKIDGGDIFTMVDSWGTGDSICDIGPMPWGDGVVDVEDLKVLAGYIGEAVDDPTLIAHWAFDEVEGAVAHDSIREQNGTVTGDAAWQPDGGRVGGALELDGVDDSVVADLILDSEEGTFSILAWIKGGAPGQVIVSQADAKLGRTNYHGCSWLGIDAVGALTTDLMSSESASVASEVIIADGQWHRVGLVWDDSSKTSTLHVDGVEIGDYLRPTLPKIYGRLQFGVGRNREPGTFFTGLIDDVRIYSRAVKP